MTHSHSGAYSSSQLSIIVESMRRPAKEIFEYCPLCNYVPEIQQNIVVEVRKQAYVDKAKALHKHIATHLEELALFSLPWQDNLDENLPSDGTQSEEMSTLKHDGVGDLDEISLTFHDPPKKAIKELADELDVKDSPDVIALSNAPWELQWGFLPKLSYGGQSDDRTLQKFIRRQLSAQVEEQVSNTIEASKIGVDSNRGSYNFAAHN